MRKTGLLAVLLIAFVYRASAQDVYIPNGSYSVHVLDRMEIKLGRQARPEEFNTTTKFFSRKRIAGFTDSLDVTQVALTKQDYFNLAYLQNDNFEWTSAQSTLSRRSFLRNTFFRHKVALYDADEGDYFKLVVNPVLHVSGGYDKAGDHKYMLASRGAEVRGSIGKHFGFYTQLIDEDFTPQDYVLEGYQRDSVFPGDGYLKTTDHRKFNYSRASDYINVNAGRFFDFQFGHGRNFIGNGYRTLLMSDFSRNHLFLRINTHVWRLNYTNIYGMIYDFVPATQKNLPQRHYYATQHLSLNITKNLNAGLFQTIVFQRDSGFSNPNFELEYLNPVIFYKAIENGLNSPDKAILGADLKYNFLKHFSLYGQFVISEFVAQEVFNGRGWFGNKYAGQLGIKYVDVLNLANLDLQLETNFARPYMYTSFTSRNAYSNYRQPMAHPLGANFREYIGIVRYQPLERLSFKGTAMIATYGNDTNGSNWGKDISRNYYTYETLYGNVIAQGVKTNLYSADLLTSYMLFHNFFIDLQLFYRKTGSELTAFESQTFMATLGIRWNLNERRWDY